MQRAFITGIDGFTGRYLAGNLRAAGYDVSGTSIQERGDAYQCDLLDVTKLRQVINDARPDVVFHLAAIASVDHRNTELMYRTNIVGTRNLLEAMTMSGNLASVLLVSSANVYGNATAGVIDEGVSPAPTNDYAVSKLAMEMMARTWSDRLPITIVRTFNYSGVGQSDSFLLPKIVGGFRRREAVLELGNIEVVRDFSDVRQIVSIYRRLMQAKATGQTLNVCSGTGHSLMNVIDIMRELSGHNLEIRVNPEFVRANEVRTLIGSRVALEKVIGRAEPIPLRETLAWMLSGT